VWDYLQKSEVEDMVEEILQIKNPAKGLSSRLVQTALQNGSDDNCSCAIAILLGAGKNKS